MCMLSAHRYTQSWNNVRLSRDVPDILILDYLIHANFERRHTRARNV